MENKTEQAVGRLIQSLERMNLEEYMRYAASWRRQLLVNFMGGLARGVGMAVGFTLLGAVLVLALRRLAAANLPVIGNFLAEIARIVLERL